MSKKAIVLGGTGAVGCHVVTELLNSKEYAQVTLLGRRKFEPEGHQGSQASEREPCLRHHTSRGCPAVGHVVNVEEGRAQITIAEVNGLDPNDFLLFFFFFFSHFFSCASRLRTQSLWRRW